MDYKFKDTDKKKEKVKSLSHVRLFGTLWILAYQAPSSMEFSRQEYWSGLPFPSAGDLPNPEIEPRFPHCRQTLYHLNYQGSPQITQKRPHSSIAKCGLAGVSLSPLKVKLSCSQQWKRMLSSVHSIKPH